MKNTNLQEVKNSVAIHKNNAIELLQQLIRIPSVNHPPTGDEKKVQRFYFKYLKSLGLEAEMHEPSDLTEFKNHPGRYKEHKMKNRPNVVGILRGIGGGKSLMLIAHADTELPGDKKLWIGKNPFSGKIHKDRVYGRGSGDDKSGMAVAASVAKILKDAEIKLKGDLIIASVCDEEQAGGNGTVTLLSKGYKADASIYLDGCNNDICTSNVGGGFCNITFKVPKSENSQKLLKDNLAAFKKLIDKFIQIRKKAFVENQLFNSRFYLSLCTRILNISLGAANPTTGSFTVWFYLLPNEDPMKFKKDFEKFIFQLKESCNYKIKWMSRFLPASQVSKTHLFVNCLKNSFKLAANQSAKIAGGPMCDMGFVNKYGRFPCVLFGPIRAAKKGAFHQPNEFIEIKEFMNCLLTTTICAMNWCGWYKEKIND